MVDPLIKGVKELTIEDVERNKLKYRCTFEYDIDRYFPLGASSLIQARINEIMEGFEREADMHIICEMAIAYIQERTVNDYTDISDIVLT